MLNEYLLKCYITLGSKPNLYQISRIKFQYLVSKHVSLGHMLTFLLH